MSHVSGYAWDITDIERIVAPPLYPYYVPYTLFFSFFFHLFILLSTNYALKIELKGCINLY
jgi:hypothetical protein